MKKLKEDLFNNNRQFNLFYFLAVFFIVLLIQDFFLSFSQNVVVPYSEYRQMLKNNQISEVMIYENEVRGVLKERNKDGKKIVTAKLVKEEIAKELDELGVKYTRIIETTFFRDIFSWLFPFMIFFGIWFFLSRRFLSQGGGSFMSIGKSKAKVYVEKDIKISFEDVAGVDEAKVELTEIVDFLTNPKAHSKLGAKMPKGVLLVGPPGTGKTLLAKAVAGEAKVPFFSINGSEFVEMFVGVGAARVRDLFEQARSQAPCIIFIDELDALGKARGYGPMSGGHDEKEQTLNQLLVELDGFDSKSGVILLAATNRPEILDPALLRAGRFDRQVLVDRPEKIGRLAILKVHIRKIKISDNLDLEQVASLTPGFTGADLANLVNEAALSATRNNRECVTLEDFNLAIERITAGLEKKSRILNKKERKIVAYHEMGHAFVANALPLKESYTVHKVSIIPRGIGALGYTIQRPTEDRYLMTFEELKNKMSILLGGRAAEVIFFGEISTGSSDDIAKATDMAKSIATQYGMVEELGHVVYEKPPRNFLEQSYGGQKQYSEESAKLIDKKIKELLNEAFDEASRIIAINRDLIDEAANSLLKKETLNQKELESYFSQIR
jgi:cell division protease FtsH